jgi:hypothetical protein
MILSYFIVWMSDPNEKCDVSLRLSFNNDNWIPERHQLITCLVGLKLILANRLQSVCVHPNNKLQMNLYKKLV